MKTNEIIQIAALVAVAASLLLRKYGKKIKGRGAAGKDVKSKSPLSAMHPDDDYEPYSGKK